MQVMQRELVPPAMDQPGDWQSASSKHAHASRAHVALHINDLEPIRARLDGRLSDRRA